MMAERRAEAQGEPLSTDPLIRAIRLAQRGGSGDNAVQITVAPRLSAMMWVHAYCANYLVTIPATGLSEDRPQADII